MYDVHRLRLLRELKLRGTLAAVAEALSYSPSSISAQLSQLEAEVGVPLLEPAGRRVRLTEQAEILVAHTDLLLQRLELAESDIAASLTTVTGELRVASLQTASLALVPAALTAMRIAHPQLRIHLTPDEPRRTVPGLLARDFDLVLSEVYPGDPSPQIPGTQVAHLGTDRLRFSGGQVLTDDLTKEPSKARSTRTRALRLLAAAATKPWIMEPPGSASRQWAMTLCHEAGFEPDIRFESADVLLHVRMVEQHLAVALLPDLVWAGQPASVPLIDLPLGMSTRHIVTLCRDGASRKPSVVAFRKALSDAMLSIYSE